MFLKETYSRADESCLRSGAFLKDITTVKLGTKT